MIGLYHRQGYTFQTADKIASSVNIFSIVVVITILLVLVGIFSIISNMILFARSNFILRVTMNATNILMPFLYDNRIWFLLYELLSCSLFFAYLYILSINHNNEDVEFNIF